MNQATKRYRRIAQYLPAQGEALSPRTPPPAIRASGAPGRATTRQTADPTQGRHGAGTRRPKGNTLRNARHGGGRVHYFEPAELDATPRPTVSAPPRTPNRAYDAATYQTTLAIAEAAGHRDRAMQRHSILTTNGAVDVLPRTGPVWLSDL